ncbi:MAG: hypothetical protein H6605_07920 [Flavobacteriales bacterium]|nr:hypothetical protein [Flavobacteriales bacterium]
MKRFLRTTLCIFILTHSVFAQVLDWSNTQKLRGNSIFTTIVGENQTGIYIIRHRNKFLSRFVVLERYRHNLGLENSKSIMLKNSRVLYADLNAQGLMLIKQNINKKTNHTEITATYFNAAFEITIPEQIIVSVKNFDWGETPEFTVRPTPDHQHFFIFSFDLNKTKNCNFRYTIFKNDLSKVSEGSYKFKPEEAISTITGLETENDLEFFFLAKRKKGNLGFEAYLTYQQHADSGQVTLLDNDEYIYEKPIIFYNPITLTKGISGFYSKADQYGYQGSYTLIWKDTASERNLYFHPFSRYILKELEGENVAASGHLPSGYGPLKVISRTDGGYLKVFENTFVQKDRDIIMMNGVSSAQGKNIYNYENVLIQNFDSSGDLEWENRIYKNQTTINDGGILGSVCILVSESKVNFVYNDPITSSGDIVLTQFYADSYKETKVLAQGDQMNAFIIPLEGKQISKDKMIIPVLKDRKFALLKISF